MKESYSGTYLILSLKWSNTHEHLVWWGPNNAGYTADIDKAGRYTAERVQANSGYYDNDTTTRAVPLYNVLEGLLGPVRRIVDVKFRYPTKTYECHACLGEIKMHPEADVVKCAHCEACTCDICYDEGRCPEKVSARGGHTTQEFGA